MIVQKQALESNAFLRRKTYKTVRRTDRQTDTKKGQQTAEIHTINQNVIQYLMNGQSNKTNKHCEVQTMKSHKFMNPPTLFDWVQTGSIRTLEKICELN